MGFQSQTKSESTKISNILCSCSGEQKIEDMEPAQSPISLATRDFSIGACSARTSGLDSRLEDSHVEEVETTLREALCLNYEEARALLGRLEYQKGNYRAALQVFQGIDIPILAPRMTKAIAERAQQSKQTKNRRRSGKMQTNMLSMHSVSLLLEAILLKANSLEVLGCTKEAAVECEVILEVVESALPNGLPVGIFNECKLQEILHKAILLLPKLWTESGYLEEAIEAYRRALIRPWNLEHQSVASMQKRLAATLLYSGAETPLSAQLQMVIDVRTPKNNLEEAILLLLLLMKEMIVHEISWDPEVVHHLAFALTISSGYGLLANNIEELLPGTFQRAERWFFLALCYSATGQSVVALNLLRKALSDPHLSEYLPALLLAAKLCNENPENADEAIQYARRAVQLSEHQGEDHHLNGVAYHILGISYGVRGRFSVSDEERLLLHESVKMLKQAALIVKDDPEVIFDLGFANAILRNLNEASENLKSYLKMVTGSTLKGWKHLALLMSAENRFEDAETIVDLALDETGKADQLEFLRLKGLFQMANDQPKVAVETYKILLGSIRVQKALPTSSSKAKARAIRDLEVGAWNDLANIYLKLGIHADAKICLDKALATDIYSPMSWHSAGCHFESQSMLGEALQAFSVALSIQPDHVPSMVSTAAVLRQLGNKSLPIARSLLMNALRLDPTNHEAWLNLGYVAKTEGSFTYAAECFQAAFDLQQSSPVLNFV